METLKKGRQHPASRRGGQPQPPTKKAQEGTPTPQPQEATPNRDCEQEGRTERQPRSGTRREVKPPRGKPTRNAKRSLTSTRKKEHNVLGHWFLVFTKRCLFFQKNKHYVFRLQCAMCCYFKRKNQNVAKPKKHKTCLGYWFCASSNGIFCTKLQHYVLLPSYAMC